MASCDFGSPDAGRKWPATQLQSPEAPNTLGEAAVVSVNQGVWRNRHGSRALVYAGKHQQLRLTHQRNLANLRERKRMMLINKAFEVLKAKLPICERNNKQQFFFRINSQGLRGGAIASTRKKCTRLTKVDILRLTINYIKHLKSILNEPNIIVDHNDKGATIEPMNLKTLIPSTSMTKTAAKTIVTAAATSTTSLNAHGTVAMQTADYKRNRYRNAKHSSGTQMKNARNAPPEMNQKQKRNNKELIVCWKRPTTEFPASNQLAAARYLLSWSRLSDSVDNQSIHAEASGDLFNGRSGIDFKDTKLWIPESG